LIPIKRENRKYIPKKPWIIPDMVPKGKTWELKNKIRNLWYKK